ncbi:hypothetical protein AAFF_G00309860 [Aldrovandia affinis]|uniref:Uncharacterized protein n=1 Tax=Aldrovandia affinis TaxID=143900 RepID=A0AAD7SPU6_9TELE|nr:hypothetical protein AAFF_G00309860 [Aldrovandia affinis]
MSRQEEKMERVERNTGLGKAPVDSVDLERILKQLDSMLECMNKLRVETQLLQCNLTICFTDPDKMAAVGRGAEGAAWSGASARPEE